METIQTKLKVSFMYTFFNYRKTTLIFSTFGVCHAHIDEKIWSHEKTLALYTNRGS